MSFELGIRIHLVCRNWQYKSVVAGIICYIDTCGYESGTQIGVGTGVVGLSGETETPATQVADAESLADKLLASLYADSVDKFLTGVILIRIGVNTCAAKIIEIFICFGGLVVARHSGSLGCNEIHLAKTERFRLIAECIGRTGIEYRVTGEFHERRAEHRFAIHEKECIAEE